ncbi:MAG: hypothetical protein DRN96_09015 [Thermoproteota archaeon]|nr:MAG: hypothetical protein DRN96_09015 [Candidatus Korarchaeota archaeon]
MRLAASLDLGLMKPRSWKKGMKALREAGATRVELQFNSYVVLLAAEKLEWKKLKDMMQEASLKTAGVHAPFMELNLASPVPSERRTAEKAIEKTIEAAYRLEAEYIVIHPGTVTIYQWVAEESSEEEAIAALVRLTEKASDADIAVGLENLVRREYRGYWLPEEFPHMKKPLISTPEEHAALVSAVGTASAVLDIGHYILTGISPEKAIQKLAPVTVAIHAHNNDRKIDCHWPLNRGYANWTEITGELEKIGYRGYLTIENFRADWVKESIEYLAAIKPSIF